VQSLASVALAGAGDDQFDAQDHATDVPVLPALAFGVPPRPRDVPPDVGAMMAFMIGIHA
jgi:hypothetical protein